MNRIGEIIRNSGKPLEWISARSGIDGDRLAALRDGTAVDASLAELRALAGALRRSLADFTEPDAQTQKTELLFRRALRPSDVPEPAIAFSRQVSRVLEVLERTPTELDWLKAFLGKHETYADAERHADTFRRLFLGGDAVSPLFTLPHLVSRSLGILLFVLPGEKLDGASAITEGHAFVFISPRTFVPRMLFTLGHEVAHILAHHDPTDFATLDLEGDVGRYAEKAPGPENGYLSERYCDAFASCLLLPAPGVGVTLETIRETFKIEGPLGDVELIMLAQTYGVSFNVAAKRCEDLGLLPRGAGYSIYEMVTKRHGSPEKRAAELGIDQRVAFEFPAVPSRVLDAALEKVREGEISIGRAAALLATTVGGLVRANKTTGSA